MLFSTSILNDAIKKYQKKRKESFSQGETIIAGFGAGFTSFMLVFALVFFAFEIILLYFAVLIAISCTQGGYERIVHVVLAMTFTLPYMLINVFFNDCAKNILKNSGSMSLTKSGFAFI